MGNLISIPNDTSLKKLVALGNKLEEMLQEQFGIYGPTVYWQLLDEELMSMREKKNKRRESVCFRHLGVYHSGRHPLFLLHEMQSASQNMMRSSEMKSRFLRGLGICLQQEKWKVW